ncbi:hypothetical protein CALVIDRAFT_157262 [Calocera viscosa TUFC12733]|uniref:Uncharacterized protein n=1 Tax=Calocera viscosa (strain TUFC12733) TaxID=1330018 RepID=A0A167LAU8_CALVF|nr:hypothetical protein CALVIDRAFT_157262 [Calocera viscosa TUFC12733]
MSACIPQCSERSNSHVYSFSDPLTPVTKRYLDIAQRDKNGGPSKPALSKSTKGPAPPSKSRSDLSASTSAALPAESGASRPAAHGRSASTTAVLGQPVRPKLVASQTERPAKADTVASLAKSVNAVAPRPRAPSASSGSSSRPTSSLAHAPPPRPASVLGSGSSRPVKPFAPSRSVTESSKPQRLPTEFAKPAQSAVSRGFMRPTASSTGAQRSVSTSAAPTQASTSSGPSRPPMNRPPTAPAALFSASASRRAVAHADSSKASAAGKILQGGAKRVVSAQSGKTPTAALLAQAIRKNGFVPKRAAQTPTPGMSEVMKEAEEESRASSPAVMQEAADVVVSSPADAVDAHAAMQAIQEDEPSQQEEANPTDELSIEDLVVMRPDENGDDMPPLATEHNSFQPSAETAPDPEMPEVIDEPIVVTDVTDAVAKPEVEAVEAVTVVPKSAPPAEEEDLSKTVRHGPSPVMQRRPHAHHNASANAEDAAGRAARHAEKRRAFEALSAAEQEAIRQRKREKRAQRAREHEEQERRAHAELQHAAAIPLPPDNEELQEPLPVPGPDFAATMEARTESPIDIYLQMAAAVPFPKDADEGLHTEARDSEPISLYTVSLPIVKMPSSVIRQHLDHESDASSSRSHTPEEAHYGHLGPTSTEEDETAPETIDESGFLPNQGSNFKDVSLLPELVFEKESIVSKAVEEDGKHARAAVDRLFAEVDVNALVR